MNNKNSMEWQKDTVVHVSFLKFHIFLIVFSVLQSRENFYQILSSILWDLITLAVIS